MKTHQSRFASAIIILVALPIFGQASASDTDIWLNVEGNPTCSSLGDNQAVLEMRDNDPIADSWNSISGNRVDANGAIVGTQTIQYYVTSLPGKEFEVSTWFIEIDNVNGPVTNDNVNAVNYTILKARGNAGARVYHFGGTPGSKGAVADTTAESAPEQASLQAVSFCYGLTVGFTPPQPPIDISDLPACDDLNGDGIPTDFFTTGIDCPAPSIDPVTGRPNEQLIINMAMNEPQFGFDFINNAAVRACTCNSTLKACNPDLAAQRVNNLGQYVDANGNLVDQNGDPTTTPVTADDLSSAERTCLEYNPDSTNDRGTPDGVNDRVPFVIQGVENPDSYVCYVVGGTRYCYGHY